jgi:hypothetical protein
MDNFDLRKYLAENKLNENQNDLIILKNLTDKRNSELFDWMKSNLTTEPYNFGLLWLNGPLEGGEIRMVQKNKFNQEDEFLI